MILFEELWRTVRRLGTLPGFVLCIALAGLWGWWASLVVAILYVAATLTRERLRLRLRHFRKRNPALPARFRAALTRIWWSDRIAHAVVFLVCDVFVVVASHAMSQWWLDFWSGPSAWP